MKSTVADKAIISIKTGLGDLFDAISRDPSEFRIYRNKIDRKHVDFLLCDPKTVCPVVGIELDDSSGGADPEVLLQHRLDKGKERLDSAIEAIDLLCEPVEPPRGELEHIHYFCGNTEIPTDLQDHEPQRVALYRATVSLIRSYANIADELEPAGYSAEDVVRIKKKLDQYLSIRDIVRRASGETLDLKPYEADMRHLIDTYIEADEPRKISPFEDIGLLDLIDKTGIADAIAAQLGSLQHNKAAVAEVIENNVRNVIIRDRLTDPAFYEKMSTLLDEIIAARKARAIEYEEYLKKMGELAKDVTKGHSDETPTQLNTPGKRALYSNLLTAVKSEHATGEPAGVYTVDPETALTQALQIDSAIRSVRPDDWRGHQPREQVIKRALYDILNDYDEVERIFKIIFQQHEY